MLRHAKALACAATVAACGGANHTALAQSQNQSMPFTVTELANFEVPWSMAFLPDGGLLVTEQKGALKLRSANGTIATIKGVPAVSYGGQGGFSEIVLHPISPPTTSYI